MKWLIRVLNNIDNAFNLFLIMLAVGAVLSIIFFEADTVCNLYDFLIK